MENEDDGIVKVLELGILAEKYARLAQYARLEQSAYARQMECLARAAKSHLEMVSPSQARTQTTAPLTVLELLAEIKGRIRIPRTFVTPGKVDPGPPFWEELDALVKSTESKGDDIVLEQEQYEAWIKRAEHIVAEHHQKCGYSQEYNFEYRDHWLGRYLTKHGVEAFNTLRKRHQSWNPRLRLGRDREFLLGVNFSHTFHAEYELAKTDMSYCYFWGSTFYKMSLAQSNLTWANLSYCNLEGVNLKEATLNMADLRGVNFKNADLRGAHLNQANLENAQLAGAKLEGAEMATHTLERVADLAQVNLFGVKLLYKSHYQKYLRQLRASIQFNA